MQNSPTIFLSIFTRMNATIKGAIDDDLFAFLNVFVFNTDTYEVCKGIKAIIDTGAQDCLIKRNLATKLGLRSVDKLEELNPVGGIITSDYFKIGLITDTENYMDTSKYAILQAGAIEEAGYPADMILGATFLRHCTFNYDGRNKTFEIHIQL